MKELLDSDRVNYLVWRFVVSSSFLPDHGFSKANIKIRPIVRDMR